MSNGSGYFLHCHHCGHRTESMREWLEQGQACRWCGRLDSSIHYDRDYESLRSIIADPSPAMRGLWRYRDFLPITDGRSIVTLGEGAAPVERCEFLEEYAADAGIHCRVFTHRHDLSSGTGTMKDLTGSLLASILKENGVRNYVAATTGNLGVALSRYLSAAGIRFWAFLPRWATVTHDQAIRACGQNVIRIDGDYAAAQAAARRFADSVGYLASVGGRDPLRLEAAKTMAFEWLCQIGASPTVYVQALSGGTGPLGIAKGFEELRRAKLAVQLPRIYAVQTDQCAPMATAWRGAQNSQFPEGWTSQYPVLKDPATDISTLATGNPISYPHVARLVRATRGQILAVPETEVHDAAALVQARSGFAVGQAAAVAVRGFFEMVHHQHVRTGDTVVVAISDGIARAPDVWRRLAEQTAATIHRRSTATCFPSFAHTA